MFKNNSADTFIKEMWVLLIEEMGEIADSHLITKIMKFILELTLYYTHVCMPPLLGISWSIMFYPCPHEVSAQYLMPPSLGSRSIPYAPIARHQEYYILPMSAWGFRSIPYAPITRQQDSYILPMSACGFRSIPYAPITRHQEYYILPMSAWGFRSIPYATL